VTDAAGLCQFSNLRINLGGAGKRLSVVSKNLDSACTNVFSLQTVTNLQCSLSVAKSYKDTITFRMLAWNLGPSDVASEGVVIIDSLKSGLVLTTDSIKSPGWTWGNILPNATAIAGTYKGIFAVSFDSVKTISFSTRIKKTSSDNLIRMTAAISLVGEGTDSGNRNKRYILPPLTLNSMRPGDCNNDGIVSGADIIPIALCYNDSGPSRWGQPTYVEQFLPFGWDTTSARADCNGDGRVDARDVRVLACNFGRREWAGLTPDTCGQSSLYRDAVLSQLLAAARVLPEGQARTEILNELLGSSGDGQSIPTEWSIAQNYPNPFNGQTTIRVGIPTDAARLSLAIYDVLGRRVAGFEKSDARKGWYDFRWNGQRDNGGPVTSGIYFYRLESPAFSLVYRMLYIK